MVGDDEIRLYYRGSNIPHIHIGELMGTRRKGRELRGDELGLARLRLDGFASIAAGDPEGTLTTKPLHFDGGSALRLNADARGGSLRVEALNIYGEPVAGFTRDQCQIISGDSQNHQVVWNGGGKLGEIASTGAPALQHAAGKALFLSGRAVMQGAARVPAPLQSAGSRLLSPWLHFLAASGRHPSIPGQGGMPAALWAGEVASGFSLLQP